MNQDSQSPLADLPVDHWPGPADVQYQAQAQAGGFGQTLASFVKFLDLPPAARVLDVGAGPGLFTRLAAAEAALAVGVDLSQDMLRHARTLLPHDAPSPTGASVACALAAADAVRLPFPASTFDAAAATNLLFLLPDPALGVGELVRVVCSGGIVGWLNPSGRLTQAAAAAFADERGLTGFARFSLINYGRIAEQYPRLSDEQWVGLAAVAGLAEIKVEGRGGGLMTLLKGRKRNDA